MLHSLTEIIYHFIRIVNTFGKIRIIKVDMDDFIRILRGFASENNDNTLLRQCVDLNEDGAVTVADLAIIKANFGLTADAYAGN